MLKKPIGGLIMWKFKDTRSTQAEISYTSTVHENCFWIRIKDEKYKRVVESTKEIIYPTIYLNKLKAEILISQLQDWIEEEC